MSQERHPIPEHKELKKGQELDVSEEVSKNLERLEAMESAPENEPEVSAETIRKSIETEAKSAEQIKETEKPAEQTDKPYSVHMHAKLKVEAYQKTLKDIQARLSTKDRRFSRFVHKPIIETVSEVASKTVARPVGIAWGSIITFIGVTISLLYAYRYGIPFNYLLFILLFISGYIFATVLELGAKVLIRRKS
jgi:preprotein translocase subunit SecF